jgi:polysaccharide biosynthesis protein PslH
MKILMLTPYLPYPPSSGGQIRSYNLIKQLSKKHEITLCSLIKFEEEKNYMDKLRPFCKNIYVFKRPEKPFAIANILKTGLSTFPLLVIRNFSRTEKKALGKILDKEKFDIIHAETFYVSPHIPKTNIPLVLVDQTIEYQVYKHFVDRFRFPFLKPLLNLDVLKLKYWEIFYWKKASRVIAVSEEDARIMKHLVPGIKVETVPNGVGEDLMEEVPLHFNYDILFIGNYLWLQNAEAARILATKVFPLIKKAIPQARINILGQNTSKIEDLRKIEGVRIKDLKVDDIEGVKEAYQKSGILIAPLYGPGGTRLKVLGAMAAKLPVVTTRVGIAGIGKNNQSYLEGETPEELAKRAIELFRDEKLYEKLAVSARKLVIQNYSYEKIAEKLDKVYQEVISE